MSQTRFQPGCWMVLYFIEEVGRRPCQNGWSAKYSLKPNTFNQIFFWAVLYLFHRKRSHSLQIFFLAPFLSPTTILPCIKYQIFWAKYSFGQYCTCFIESVAIVCKLSYQRLFSPQPPTHTLPCIIQLILTLIETLKPPLIMMWNTILD